MSSVSDKRYESFRVDLLDSNDTTLGTIGMVKGGVIDWSIYNTIKTGGNIEIVTHKDATDVNWLNSRVKIFYIWQDPPIIDDYGTITQSTKLERALGVFITSTPEYIYSDTGISAKVELYDKLIMVSQDAYHNTSYIGKGRKILQSAVEILSTCNVPLTQMNIDPTKEAEVAKDHLIWEAGTSKLQMINDLLDIIQYRSLWVDVNGKFRLGPWIAPKNRALEYDFKDDNSSIYLSDFTIEEDFFDIPTHIIAISKASGDSEVPEDEKVVSIVLSNYDINSPYSVQNRGRKIVHVERNVEVPEGSVEERKAALKQYAKQVLSEKINTASTIQITHALVPDLYLTDRVRFRNDANGIMSKEYTVTDMRMTLSAGALVETTLRDIIDDTGFDSDEQ